MKVAPWFAAVVLSALAGAAITSAADSGPAPPTAEPAGKKSKTIAMSCVQKGDKLRCKAKRKGLMGRTGPAGPQGPAGANGTNGTNGTNGAAGPPGPTAFASDSQTTAIPLGEPSAEARVLGATITTTFESQLAVQASVGLDSPGVVVPALGSCFAWIVSGTEGVGDLLSPRFSTEVSPFLPPIDATLSITGSNPSSNPTLQAGTYEIAVDCRNENSGQLQATSRALNVTAVAAP